MAFFRQETAAWRNRDFAAFVASPKTYVLRGRVVTMDDARLVIDDGFVAVVDDTISLVGRWTGSPPPPFESAPVVLTAGTIYPGLIELHNHPAYNVVPMWPVPRRFDNRAQWRADGGYKRWVSNTDNLLCKHPNAIYPKALVRFVECRALLGGVTTTQGLYYENGTQLRSFFEGLVRNVEFPIKNWPTASDFINDFASSAEAQEKLGPALAAGTPYIIHLCEGTDVGTRAIFDRLRRADGTWIIGPSLVAIHCVALEDADFRVLSDNRAGGLVWSPLSNMMLYGGTTKIELARRAGLRIAIGCDWAPSGTKNLLGELKVAKIVSDHLGGLFSDRELVEAVTRVPASMMGWDAYIGTVEGTKAADFLILNGTNEDPYSMLLDADESDIVGVVIAGRPRSGRPSIVDPTTPGVELIQIAGQALALDIVESANHPLGGTSLGSATTTMDYALAHLPDVAREAQALAPHMLGAAEQWRPVPDYEEPAVGPLFALATLPRPDEVDPLSIEPITAVDDPGFADRIRANINVPAWFKDRL